MLDLTELGLNNNESKAFNTLVKLGKSNASSISKESGVPYGRIYSVLDSLEHKGFIKVIPEKTKKFVVSNPKTLENIIQKRKNRLDKLHKKIKNFKKVYESKEKQVIEIARGKRNFYKLERELPKPKKTFYNIKYSVKYNPIWAREHKNYLKNGIELKELVRMDSETINNIKKWLKIHKNIKQIENDGVAISVIDDSMILMALIKSNVSILIRDISFIKLMKELIGNYYDQKQSINISKSNKSQKYLSFQIQKE